MDYAQYGILGAIISALVVQIARLERRHKSERKEWLGSIEKMFDKQDLRTEKTNEIIRDGNDKIAIAYRENTSVLSGLKALLEVKNRR